MGDIERWHLVEGGHEHVVTVEQHAFTREVAWTRDGTEVGRTKTSDDTIVLAPTGADGAVRLRCAIVGPTRRVTLHDGEAEAHTGLGGTDLEPAAGSRAARRAEWIGAHPHLHTARQTAIAAAGVGVPVLLVWLLSLVPWPSLDIPWPDISLPSIPWPDLPSIPWPDITLPSIPWPDIDLPSLPSLPAWTEPVRQVLVPVLIAFFLARGEVKRRRRAEEKARAEAREKAAEESAEEAREESLDLESPGDSRPSAVTDPRP
ncbi:hypothetical protein [Nocardioides sp. zg-1228]|uniref:hypothetical protein n=1 Tax=Nocardioides sp. zg-1228 TaxID=2763008 RepID=UPI00164345DD|nr:hypothetical protein [Nocardioides sp. zg-1228]MBC2933266.1 hypothetical protein [Nocardioides sp. zg-1228]QSF56569.1 hypothetical protein JX575_13125 [Nocardioides sp. zg-1228]